MLGSVDGSLDERELAFVVGMTEAQVAEMLERLAMLGVVDLRTESAAGGRGAADGIEVGTEERAEIDHLFSALTTADYYLLLGVEREARPKDIKKAYYRLAPRYHPDRYFGRQLGPYKGRIEAIFAALTKAHDTLRYPKRRADYDAALPPLRPGDRVRHSIHPAHLLAPESDAGVGSGPAPRDSQPGARRSSPGGPPSPRDSVPSAPVVEARGSVAPAGSVAPPVSSPRAPQQSRPPEGVVTQAAPVVRRRKFRGRPSQNAVTRDAEAERLHKEALARKLAGNKLKNLKKAGKHASEARVTQLEDGAFKQAGEVRKSAAEHFRGRYDKLAETAKQKRLEKYLEQGQTAMDSGDYRVAAAAFQQALKLNPEDEEVVHKLETATALALRG